MSVLDGMNRLLAPIRRKLFLLLGRAILQAVDNSEGTQKVQLTLLKDEIITGVERFQEYGFETYPFPDAEALALFLGGNRNQGIAVCVHDRRYRPDYLLEGEVCLYTNEDDPTKPFRIHLMQGRRIETWANYMLTNTDSDVDIVCGGTYTISADGDITLNAGTGGINLLSDEVALGGLWGTLRALIDERFIALFNAHVHSDVTAGLADTGVPTVLMAAANHATEKVKGI